MEARAATLMRWLPEYGVGIIGFGNRTYTSWGASVAEAIGLLNKTGALVPREPVPSAALIGAKDRVSRLIMHWSDALADSLASENLFMDRSRDRRRTELEGLLAKTGTCSTTPAFAVVENALRGAVATRHWSS